MSRFCKTCRFLVADKANLLAECMFWVEFAKTAPKPFAKIGGPIFRPMSVPPRFVWDDLPTPPDLVALGHDFAADPWSEVMDCPEWQSA